MISMRGHLIPTALPGAATNDLVLETQPWKAKQNGYGFSEMSCKRPEKQRHSAARAKQLALQTAGGHTLCP